MIENSKFQDEVAFIQNLVYYVERAYRTPDFGMWERGTKYNDGTPEIHASSIGYIISSLCFMLIAMNLINYKLENLSNYLFYFIFTGMAKSALEAINGCNLFGDKGASWSIIYVDIDAHNRNRSIFEALLPKESSSKVSQIKLFYMKMKISLSSHDSNVNKVYLLKSFSIFYIIHFEHNMDSILALCYYNMLC